MKLYCVIWSVTFRKLEQISDANQIATTTERLRLKDWERRLLGANLEYGLHPALMRAGFTQSQAEGIVKRRQERPFLTVDDCTEYRGG